jgi:hypothetical protein
MAEARDVSGVDLSPWSPSLSDFLQPQPTSRSLRAGSSGSHGPAFDEAEQSGDLGIDVTASLARLPELLLAGNLPLLCLGKEAFQQVLQTLRPEQALGEVIQHHAVQAVHPDERAGVLERHLLRVKDAEQRLGRIIGLLLGEAALGSGEGLQGQEQFLVGWHKLPPRCSRA